MTGPTAQSAPDSFTNRFRWEGPAAVGALTLTQYQLPGAVLTEYEGLLQRPLTLHAQAYELRTAMVFQRQGRQNSLMEKRRPFVVEALQTNCIYEPSDDMQHGLEPTNGRFYAWCLHFDQAYFADLLTGNAAWLPLYEKFLNGQEPSVLFPTAQPAALQALELLAQLRACPYTGTLQKLYLQSRLFDLFVVQQQHYLQRLKTPGGQRRQQELAHAVREYLDHHYAEPPGLHELARLFGTNDCSLKRGFRQEFQTTIFGYVAEKRLKEAHLLLAQTQLPIEEVAARVGYAGAANFATAFKRRFGLTPRQVRNGLAPSA